MRKNTTNWIFDGDWCQLDHLHLLGDKLSILTGHCIWFHEELSEDDEHVGPEELIARHGDILRWPAADLKGDAPNVSSGLLLSVGDFRAIMHAIQAYGSRSLSLDSLVPVVDLDRLTVSEICYLQGMLHETSCDLLDKLREKINPLASREKLA